MRVPRARLAARCLPLPTQADPTCGALFTPGIGALLMGRARLRASCGDGQSMCCAAAQGQLWLIDVSQSVDLDHPRALDFLREVRRSAGHVNCAR